MRVDLSCFRLGVQAALSDCVSFDPFTFELYDLAASEVDVGWGEIVEALVVSLMIVMLDEVNSPGLSRHPQVQFLLPSNAHKFTPHLSKTQALRKYPPRIIRPHFDT